MVQTTSRRIFSLRRGCRRLAKYIATIAINLWLRLETQTSHHHAKRHRHIYRSAEIKKPFSVVFISESDTPLSQSIVIVKPSKKRMMPDHVVTRLFALRAHSAGRKLHMINQLTLSDALQTIDTLHNTNILKTNNYDYL